MTDPSCTRAIFVRDPLERFISSYLDKVIQNPDFFASKCCHGSAEEKTLCVKDAQESPSNFLNRIQTCPNAHWQPQSWRMPVKYWEQINFVGQMDQMASDARRLLKKIGAWDAFGAQGWKNGPIFFSAPGQSGRFHATGAKDKAGKMLNPELARRLRTYYGDDYRNPVIQTALLRQGTA